MGFKRPEVQILSPRPILKAWYDGKKPEIPGFFMSIIGSICLSKTAFFDLYARIEFPLRGKTVVVCGSSNPEIGSKYIPLQCKIFLRGFRLSFCHAHMGIAVKPTEGDCSRSKCWMLNSLPIKIETL